MKAIRVGIEFSIAIGAVDFLMEELFDEFSSRDLNGLFLDNLLPFILSEKLRKYTGRYLSKIVYYYKEKQDFENLEKIIMCLNFEDDELIMELTHICETNCLSSGLLYLLITQLNKSENTQCLEILFQIMKLKKRSKIEVNLKDLYMLTLNDEIEYKEKRKITSSKLYLGYKLLWVINKFLEGRFGAKNHMSYTYHIVKFV